MNQNPPISYATIVADVKDAIIRGDHAPGERLDSRAAYEKRYKTTPNTVQRAFSELVADGYVRVAPKQGTFVADTLPCDTNIAILIRSLYDSPGWSQFWTEIRYVAEQLSRETPYNLSIRTGIDPVPATGEYHALVDDIEQRRLGGLIYAYGPELTAGTPVNDTPGLGRVSLMGGCTSDLPRVGLDVYGFCDRALDHLKAQGRRRVAAICMPGTRDDVLHHFEHAAAERGLIVHDYWIQAIGIENARWAENLARLLLEGTPDQRPDGLVLMDDNHIPAVGNGILKTGLRVGRDLDVVAHANFPLLAEDTLPITRIGFDIRAMLETCLDLVRGDRRGEAFEERILLPAAFAEDLGSHAYGKDHAHAPSAR